LFRGIVAAVRNVEEVTDFIEENLLALLHADVLAHDDEPIGPRAFEGPIFYLGNILADQPLVLIALETNNALFGNVVRRIPRRASPRAPSRDHHGEPFLSCLYLSLQL
jgi:hypothetical protein